MNPTEVLRIVDAIHRDKNIDKEVVFEAIEAALVSAAKRHYGEEEDIAITIDREDGSISGTHNGVPLRPEEISERIAAQTAKQVMIQKIREAERDALFDEYKEHQGPTGHRRGPAVRGRSGHGDLAQCRGDPAQERADSRRDAPRQRTRSGDGLRGAQAGAAASRSSSAGPGPSWSSGSSSRKFPRSPKG